MWSLSLGFWAEVELEERTLHGVSLRSLRDWTSTTKYIGRWENTEVNALNFGEQESNLEAFRNLADLEFGEVSVRASSRITVLDCYVSAVLGLGSILQL